MSNCHTPEYIVRLLFSAAGSKRPKLDRSIKDVKPPGATAPYASPEVLYSLLMQFEGEADEEDGIMVNGSIADMWSAACILYEMLTGEKPFLPKGLPNVLPPDCVPDSLKEQWLVYHAYEEAQLSWVCIFLCYSLIALEHNDNAVNVKITHAQAYVASSFMWQASPMALACSCKCITSGACWHSSVHIDSCLNHQHGLLAL